MWWLLLLPPREVDDPDDLKWIGRLLLAFAAVNAVGLGAMVALLLGLFE